jgi:predicted ArsR family transcriptional regulator
VNNDISPSVDAVFGGKTAGQVLLYLENYGEAHGRQIAKTFGIPASMVQRQLRRFEAGGLIVGRVVGRTRLFTWNPRSQTAKNLRLFLRAELESLPEDVLDRYFRERMRPRRTGKLVEYVGERGKPG